MHVGSRYKALEFLFWSRRDILTLFLVSTVTTCIYVYFKFSWMAIPWLPVALIGTATAFMIGFKNTQSYNRLWEARKIWGGIVNSSREMALMLRDFIDTGDQELKTLYYRHIAWLTALRFQLRETRPWEHSNKPYNKEYRKFFTVPEWQGRLDSSLEEFLSQNELNQVMGTRNKAYTLLANQTEHIQKLFHAGKTDTYKQIELEKKAGELIAFQGKCERIKNFPYPRQYASINYYFVRILIFLMPLGMLNEFEKISDCFIWMTIPFSTLVSWVFISMERIGEASENPFEGCANDIPMASISRTIEIELRELLGEENLPSPIQAVNNIIL